MRVTDGSYFAMTQRNLQEVQQQVMTAQRRASANQKVIEPSDDPVAFAQAQIELTRETNADSHMRISNAGIAALNLAESSLEQLGTALQQVRERAVAALNDTMSAANRQAVAREVEQLRAAMIGMANAQVGDSYVFGGYTDGQPPFDSAGVYSGDGQVRDLEVAPGVKLPSGVAANQVFGVGVGVDVFASLQALTTALDTNNKAGIQAGLDAVITAHSQVVLGRAEVGANREAYDVAQAVTQRTKDQAILQQTALVGIDPATAALDLAKAQRALQDAVQFASRLPPPGLAQSGR